MRGATAAGVLLGLGLGGFVDGIVLHQVLQWHHMLSSTGDHPVSTVPGLEANTLWDGLFHLATLGFTVAGLGLLIATSDRGAPWPRRAFVGLVLAGWGVFNLVEGVVNHHVLGLHHVRHQGDEALPWDLGFLALGAALVLVGAVLNRGRRDAARVLSLEERRRTG